MQRYTVICKLTRSFSQGASALELLICGSLMLAAHGTAVTTTAKLSARMTLPSFDIFSPYLFERISSWSQSPKEKESVKKQGSKKANAAKK